ncbi:hypothetical protein EMCRGX_G013166 [Ephydatia muelleri]
MRCQGGEEVDPPLVPRLECVTECTVEQTRKVFDQGTIFSVKMCGGLKYNVGICSFKPTMEGLKRMLAKPTVRKEPVTANMLKAMVEATGPEPHLSKVRLLAVCLEAFAGFLHCNELIKLKCSDITFNAEDMVINVQSSKTDQYRECASLVIAHTGQWHAGPTQLLALGSIGVELVVLICIGFPILLTRLTLCPFQQRECQQPYNDPRILSCLHSFCLQCLHHEIEKSGSQQMFQCPICQQNTSIPVGGAIVLPQNLHLGFEVEVAGYMSKMTSNSDVACDQCAEGSSDPAEVFCCACHHFLCAFCLEHHKHNRMWSKHKIVGLDQEGARQLHTTMKPRDHYCSQPNHEDNKLNFYCETCSLLVCRDCTTVTHKSHSVKEISTAAKTHQMEMSGALEDAKEE